MDLWYQHAKETGRIPAEVVALTTDEIEDRLGFCRSARYRTRVRLEFPEGWVAQHQSGGETVTTFSFPEGKLGKREGITPEQIRAGMAPIVREYPISSEEDCRVFLGALEKASVAADTAGFAAYDEAVGDAGIPLLILGPCPAHFVMLELTGYETFFYGTTDFPGPLHELIRTIDRLFRDRIWDRAMGTGAELILHGTHFSDSMTPRPLFERYFLPYFAEFNGRAHGAGKRVLWHADAGMGTFLDLVLEAGFDGADCLATVPLVAETIEDYDRAWRGRIVCWGGVPGTLFNPEGPLRDFVEHIEHLRDYTAGRSGFIIGTSDNLLPGAEWERVKLLGDTFAPASAERRNQEMGEQVV